MKPPKDAAAATRAASRARKAEKGRGGASGAAKEESGEASWSSLPASASPSPSSSSSSSSTQRNRNTAGPSAASCPRAASRSCWGATTARTTSCRCASRRRATSGCTRAACPGRTPCSACPPPPSRPLPLPLLPRLRTSPGRGPGVRRRPRGVLLQGAGRGESARDLHPGRKREEAQGGPPGLVTLMSEKVVSVRPDSVASVVAAGATAEASGSESEGEVA